MLQLIKLKKKCVVILVCVIGLSACDTTVSSRSDNHPQRQSAEQQITEVKNTPIKPSYQKPGAPIQIDSPHHFQVSLGESLDIPIMLSVGASSGVLSIEIYHKEALNWEYGQKSQSFVLAEQTAQIKVPIGISALAEGRHILNVLAKVTDGGNITQRAMAIVIDVGDEPTRRQKTSRSSGGFKMLPAKETIR